MADQTISIGLEVQLQDLIAQLSKAEGITAAQASKLAKELSRSFQAAEKAAKATAKAQADANAAAKHLSNQFDSLGKVAQALGVGPLDNLMMRAEFLTKGFSSLGVGAVAGIAVAGLAAITVAAAGTALAVAKLTKVAEKYASELVKFREVGLGVSNEQLASLQRAAASVDAIRTSQKQLVAIIGTELAPAVERVSTLVVAFALAGADVVRTYTDAGNVLSGLATWLTTQLVRAFTTPINALFKAIEGFGELADVLGLDAMSTSLASLGDSWRDFTRQIAETAIDYYVDKTANAIGGLEANMGGYIARAREVVSVQQAINQETKKGKDATDKATEALEKQQDILAERMALLERLTREGERFILESLEGYERLLAEQQLELDALNEWSRQYIEAGGDAADTERAITAVVKKQAKERAAARREELDAAMEQTYTYMGVASGLFSGIADLASEAASKAGEASGKAATRWLAFYKAAAIAQVLIDSAVAITKALATLGPVLGAVASVGIAASSAAQIAQISATEIPAYPRGATIPLDHKLAYVSPGEAILNRRATTELGEDTIRKLNAGVQYAQPKIIIEQRYGHRVFDRFTQDVLKRDSPLSRAIAGRTPVGHSRRRQHG